MRRRDRTPDPIAGPQLQDPSCHVTDTRCVSRRPFSIFALKEMDLNVAKLSFHPEECTGKKKKFFFLMDGEAIKGPEM